MVPFYQTETDAFRPTSRSRISANGPCSIFNRLSSIFDRRYWRANSCTLQISRSLKSSVCPGLVFMTAYILRVLRYSWAHVARLYVRFVTIAIDGSLAETTGPIPLDNENPAPLGTGFSAFQRPIGYRQPYPPP